MTNAYDNELHMLSFFSSFCKLICFININVHVSTLIDIPYGKETVIPLEGKKIYLLTSYVILTQSTFLTRECVHV